MSKINGKNIGDIPGTSKAYYGGSVPTGYLLEDGSPHLISQYVVLFAALGGVSSPFGSPDGFSTQFYLPDSRRKVHVGSGGTGTGTLGSTVGSTGGEEVHQLTTAELASHGHSGTTNTENQAHAHNTNQTVNANTAAIGGGANTILLANNIGQGTYTTSNETAAHNHNFSTSSSGSDSAHNNIQPSLVVTKMIKV